MVLLGRGECKGTGPIFLSFSLLSCLSYNTRKRKMWQCDILYTMLAVFPHASSFLGDELLTTEPLQLLLLMALQNQLPHAGSLQLGHRSYNIWDCVTSLQGFCRPFILCFFDEMGSGGWQDPRMIYALKQTKEGQRKFDA